MGCICSKGAATDDVRAKDISKSSKRFVASLKREEAIVDSDNGGNDVTARLISNHPVDDNVVSTPISSDEGDKKEDVIEKAVKPQHQRGASMEAGANGGHVRPTVSRIISMPNGGDVAQVVAAWPSWLTAVAGEAIKGWLPRRADSFEKMDKIGQGTYSSVYRARDLETGKIVALKKVRFANMDPESVRFMAREIHILRKLDHPNVMKLEGLITSRVSGSLYLVFEYMEHDLSGLAVAPGIKLTEAQIKCYMQQLLCGLEHCHSRGVLHRDIKGSNLLIDNNGNLKIGDFGLATFFNPNQKHPLTSRVVTLWYRPPELLLGSTDYGVAVDLWSTGCILAELFAGKPIMPGRTEVEQLHKIFKLCGSPSEEYWKRSKLPHATIFKPQQPYTRCVAETFKDFPSPALALLDVLLAIQPESRGSASSALQSEFFTTKPLPCDPSSLPKYPPSKEFDAKLRNEESRRQRAAARRGEESIQKIPKESKPVLATDANAKLKNLGQKRPGQSNPKSNSEKYNPDEEGGSGFRIEPPRGTTQIVYSHSGQSVHPNTFGSSRNMNNNQGEPLIGPGRGFGSSKNGSELRSQRSFINHGASQLSRFSNSVADRGSSRFDSRTETSMHPQWLGEQLNARYNRLDNADSSHHSLDRPKSSQIKEGQSTEKDLTMNYSGKNRIHYSGPLLPSGGNIDEMLKEHEKQIQHAVRKARLDKAKTKKTFNDNGQTESLLNYQRNGR